jgi:hypothetical protein
MELAATTSTTTAACLFFRANGVVAHATINRLIKVGNAGTQTIQMAEY